jgi:Uma2 family endonuclease
MLVLSLEDRPMTAQRKQPQPPMTVDEFLAWDGAGHVGKLELVEGHVRAMAPASPTHGFIQNSVAFALTNHFRTTNSGCRVATEPPVVPPLRPKKNARAPDVAVTCAPRSDSKVFDDPVLIVEVMSPGNEDESWDSIRALAGLPSLQEILVVHSTRVEAEVYTRDATGAWPKDGVVVTAGGTVRLASIGFDVPIFEFYRDTHLVMQPPEH